MTMWNRRFDLKWADERGGFLRQNLGKKGWRFEEVEMEIFFGDFGYLKWHLYEVVNRGEYRCACNVRLGCG